MKPRALLFDAGNTLVFLDYARLASAVGEALQLPLTESGLRRHAGAAARAMEQGRLTDRERGSVYLLTLFELAGVPASRAGELKAALLALHQQAHLWGATPVGTRRRSSGFAPRDSGSRSSRTVTAVPPRHWRRQDCWTCSSSSSTPARSAWRSPIRASSRSPWSALA